MNVLFIAVDDLNDWIGCFGGNPQVKTPNIDRLAGNNAMIMMNAQCPSSLSCPSRSALPDRSEAFHNRSISKHAEPAGFKGSRGSTDIAAVFFAEWLLLFVYRKDFPQTPV